MDKRKSVRAVKIRIVRIQSLRDCLVLRGKVARLSLRCGDLRETPRDLSVCAHALLQPDLLEEPDLSADARFEMNPLVRGEPHLRFYAGAQLKTPDGLALGTVCVLDTAPRQLNDGQRAALVALARQTMTQLELRRALSIAEQL